MDQHCNFTIRSIAKTGLQRSVHVEQNREKPRNIYIYIASNVPQRNKRERLVLGRLKSGAHEERGGVTRRQSG